MKRCILVGLLLLNMLAVMAQSSYQQYLDKKAAEWRQKIGLDYSVPDYNVSKPDTAVMGWKLARILQSLERNYMQALNNRHLSIILRHQSEGEVFYELPINKFKILNIQKQDSIITVRLNLFSKTKEYGKISRDVALVFVNGVSEDDTVNTLFSDLGRYVRKDEEQVSLSGDN